MSLNSYCPLRPLSIDTFPLVAIVLAAVSVKVFASGTETTVYSPVID